MKSIFIQISSYHDYELSTTIKSAIENMSGKNIVNFGVHVIYYKNNDIEMPTGNNIKYFISKAPENIGMGIGRLIAHNFYNDEDYYVQVDSHTIFSKNWDEIFINTINQYQNLGFSKPLITSYPKNYWYENKNVKEDSSSEYDITYISFHENPEQFLNERIPSQTAMPNNNNNIFSKSVSGGSIFTVGNFIKPNPNIFANGEEILIAARAWTHGYDLLLPNRHVIKHLYYNHKNAESNKRRLVWNDFKDICSDLDIISRSEIKNILSNGVVGEFALGQDKTIEEFSVYSGLNFKNGKIEDYCSQ